LIGVVADLIARSIVIVMSALAFRVIALWHWLVAVSSSVHFRRRKSASAMDSDLLQQLNVRGGENSGLSLNFGTYFAAGAGISWSLGGCVSSCHPQNGKK
jgi:hypothetical protein